MAVSIPKEHEIPPIFEKAEIRPATALKVVQSAIRDRLVRRRQENDSDDDDVPEEKPLTEIQRWASQITNPITLTYKIICKKFNKPR